MANHEEATLSLVAGNERARAERRDALANRERLLKTAAELFAARGLDNIHMSQIAKAAGVGQGTLYRHFAGKGELCLALLDEQMRDFQARVLAELQAHVERRTPCLDQLSWFIAELAQFNTRHIPLLHAAQREMRLVDHNAESPPWVWQRMTVIGLLRRAQAAGEIDLAVDPGLIGDLLLAPLQAVAFRQLRQTHGYSATQISGGVTLLLRCLTHCGPS